MSPSTRVTVRRVMNAVNLSTLLGITIAVVGGARFSAGPGKLLLATSYRWRFPKAAAFTVGDVVVSRMPRERLEARTRLLAHEACHAGQWAWLIGLPFLVAYSVASGYSLLRCRNPALRNVFETRAGLEDGGYVKSRRGPGA